MEWKSQHTVGACCSGVILFVGMILLIVSFQYVEYNEYAFRRQKSVNKVKTNHVYKNGRYLWGPDYDLITFPRDYQRIDFNNISVSDAEEKTLYLDVSIYYLIRRKDLKLLYSKFGTGYDSTIQSKTLSVVKNTAPLFTIEEYLNNRSYITNIINTNVTDELNIIWIDLEEYKLQLKKVTLAETTIKKYLSNAIQTQENQKEVFEQEAELIRQQTTKEVEEINTNATILTEEAKAEATKIIEVAEAEADLTTSTARGLGIAEVMKNLSINNTTTKALFIKLMSILDNSDIKLVNTDNSLLINY